MVQGTHPTLSFAVSYSEPCHPSPQSEGIISSSRKTSAIASMILISAQCTLLICIGGCGQSSGCGLWCMRVKEPLNSRSAPAYLKVGYHDCWHVEVL